MVSKISSVFWSVVGSERPSSNSGPRKRALESDHDEVEHDLLESPQVKRVKSNRNADGLSPASSSPTSPAVALGNLANWVCSKSNSFANSYFYRQPKVELPPPSLPPASSHHHRHSSSKRKNRGGASEQLHSTPALGRKPLHGFSKMSANRSNQGQKPSINPAKHPKPNSHIRVGDSKAREQQQQHRGKYNSGLPPGARHKTVPPSSNPVAMVNGNGHGGDDDDDDVVLLPHHHQQQQQQHQFRAPRDVLPISRRSKAIQNQQNLSSNTSNQHRSHIPRSTTTATTRRDIPQSKQTLVHQVSQSYQPVSDKLFPQSRFAAGQGSMRMRNNSHRQSTAEQCVQLDQKQAYQDLLKQFSSVRYSTLNNNATTTGSSRHISSSSRSSSVLSASSTSSASQQPRPAIAIQRHAEPAELSRIPQKLPSQQQQPTTDIGTMIRQPIVRAEPMPGSRVLPHQFNSKRELREAVRARTHVPVSDLSPRESATTSNRPIAATPAQPDFSCNSRPESPVIIGVNPASPRLASSPRADFERSVRESPYAEVEWVKTLRERFDSSMRIKNRHAEEQQAKVKIYEERRLKEQSKVEDRIREQMDVARKAEAVIDDPVIIEDEEEEEIYDLDDKEDEDELVELTPEMEDEIDEALVPHPPDQKLLEGFKLLITRHDIQTLNGLNWLNDEVFNFYMQLIMARSQQEEFPNVHCFNTFFYPKLLKGGQPSLRRWTKRVDIFAKDFIVVPVHLGMHWCMAIIDIRHKTITYYDSMGSSNNKCLNALRDYLRAEHQDKKGSPYDTSEWSLLTAKEIPQQLNGSDCGMFACKFAEYVTRDAEITFTQHDMPYFRRRMIWEILHMKLL